MDIESGSTGFFSYCWSDGDMEIESMSTGFFSYCWSDGDMEIESMSTGFSLRGLCLRLLADVLFKRAAGIVGVDSKVFNLRHYWGIEYLGLEWGRATNCTFLNDTQFKKESIEY